MMKESWSTQEQSLISIFPPNRASNHWGLVASAKPLKPPLIFGCSGALQFKVTGVWNDLRPKQYRKKDVLQDKEQIDQLIVSVQDRLVAANNAVRLLNNSSALKDYSANGWLHYQMTGQRFSNHMEDDVRELMQIDFEEALTEEMKHQLLNDALSYISSNARQLQLFRLMQDEADILIEQLEPNCHINLR